MLLNTLLDTLQAYDFLHDPFWEFVISVLVAFTLGIIAPAITLWIYRKQRTQKVISYALISDAPIASINKEVADKVEIRFDGKPVQDLSLLVLKIWNSGNVAVKPDDYDVPITFKFEGRTVVSSDILKAELGSISSLQANTIALTSQQESVTLSKFLLNRREAISLKVLLTSPKGKIDAGARIVDGQFLQSSVDDEPVTINPSLKGAIYLVFGIALLMLLIEEWFYPSLSTGPFWRIADNVIACIVIVALLSSLFQFMIYLFKPIFSIIKSLFEKG